MLIWSWNHTPEKCASYKKGKRLLTCFGGEKILWRRAANPAQCSPVWMFAAWTGESIERHLPLAWLRAGELVVTWLGLAWTNIMAWLPVYCRLPFSSDRGHEHHTSRLGGEAAPGAVEGGEVAAGDMVRAGKEARQRGDKHR